ncbi:unnamed protein product [Cladocopium goreaui]|uniref:Uncharacterized protein n=1 Tax=Cladocopium goreaui TaxID=2562237 RepID=A0A9P1G288_9DINO|nr:unnamed protein product [Cladocopium goreaui]
MVGERTARTAPLPRLRGLQQCTAPTADGLRQPRVRRMASEVLDPENEANEAVADLPVRTAALRRFVPRLLPPGPGPNMVDSASPNSGSSLRAASAPWWEASDTVSDGSNEWSVDEFTEYTMDSHHDEVSVSTQASTRATTGSNSRHQPGFMGGGLRGARSPHTLLRGWSNTGYRGRSVTRRESQSSGAAMRHRHPTHTPSRGPNPRRFLDTALAHQGVGHLHFRPIGRVREE